MDLKGDLNIEKKITMKNREMERAFRKKKNTEQRKKYTRASRLYTTDGAGECRCGKKVMIYLSDEGGNRFLIESDMIFVPLLYVLPQSQIA